MHRTDVRIILLVLVGVLTKRVGLVGVYIGHDSDYFYHYLEDYSEYMEHPSLNDAKQEAFIIGVDKSFLPQKSKLENDLEDIFGTDFFEKNKFQLFLGLIIISACLVLSCLAFSCSKAWKIWKRQPRRHLRPISFTDKFLESGMPQETFQFMPLKALSPLYTDFDFDFQDDELPDYSQLQKKTIFPEVLYGQ